MSGFSWSIDMNGAIWILVLYVFIYYFLARAVLAKINQQIPRYFEVGDENGNLPIGMETSAAIFEMLFDGDLPGRDFGQFVRIGLYAARVMLACYVPIAGFLLYKAW
jgi:hypothetical protein